VEVFQRSARDRRVALVMCLSVVLTLLVGTSSANADRAYHTERLELAPVEGSDEAGSGMVVNIHPNGPVVGALERYQLRNATPHTEYVVWIVIGDQEFMPTATLRTDRHGNGHAKARISADDLAPFSGAVIPGLKWVLRSDNADAYETRETTVSID
jgi:hypothetical protein